MAAHAVSAGVMPAVRWHQRGDVRLDDVPVPAHPGSRQMRIAVAWCGICGSDLHEYRFGPQVIPTRPHPGTGRCAPIVLGHEISGWIERMGAEVTGFAVGDLVVLNALLPCGRCAPCRRGAVHLCSVLGHVGMSADGGLAPLLTVPADMAVRVPDGVPADVAALAEPLAVAVHALRLTGSAQVRSAVVLGAGTIGLCLALVLRERGTEVTVADVAEPRRAHARELGFRAAEPSDAPPAPLVYECSGARAAAAGATRLTLSGGTVVLLGLPDGSVPVDIADVVRREVRLVGSMSHLRDADLLPAVRFLAEHGDAVGRLITARIPLRETVPLGLAVMAGPERAAHAKILVRVGG